MSSQPNAAGDTTTTLVCAGSVTGASAVAPIAGGASPSLRGIAPSAGGVGPAAPAGPSVARTSAGLYTIQVPNLLPFTNGFIHITPIGIALSNQAFHIVSWSAAGLITVQSNLGSNAAATDSDFMFEVWSYN